MIDPRGQRFAAAVNLVLFAVALLVAESATAVAASIVAVQAVNFALGVGLGPGRAPTSLFFRAVLRPRLGPPTELEDAAPPRFANLVGLVFSVVAVVAFLAGAVLAGQIATGLAFVAAFLNAVFGYCLGCEMYLLGLRITRRTA